MKMNRTIWLVVASLMMLALPTSGAQAFTDCDVRTQTATPLPGGYYFVGVRLGEIWRESNGLPGLQTNWTHCAGGLVVAADTCVILNATSGVFAHSQCLDPTIQDPTQLLP